MAPQCRGKHNNNSNGKTKACWCPIIWKHELTKEKGKENERMWIRSNCTKHKNQTEAKRIEFACILRCICNVTGRWYYNERTKWMFQADRIDTPPYKHLHTDIYTCTHTYTHKTLNIEMREETILPLFSIWRIQYEQCQIKFPSLSFFAISLLHFRIVSFCYWIAHHFRRKKSKRPNEPW